MASNFANFEELLKLLQFGKGAGFSTENKSKSYRVYKSPWGSHVVAILI